MITRELARKFRKFIEQMSENATDEEALDNILAFPKWEVGKEYVKDERIRYENVLYKVLQSHTSQADWTPNIAVSLYVKVSIEERTNFSLVVSPDFKAATVSLIV